MRNSNVELLRILCILMIIILHVFGVFNSQHINEVSAAVNYSSLFANFLCNSAVSIFVLISGYYGIHLKWGKWLNLFNITTFYGCIWLLYSLLAAHFNAGTNIGIKDIISDVFPVFTNKYWFITSYLILMALSGYIEKMISVISQTEFLTLIFILLLFVVISPTFLLHEIFQDTGKGLFNMLTIYFIGRYVSLYDFPRIIKNHAKIIAVALIILGFGLNIIANHFGVGLVFSRDNNLLIVLLAVCLFYIVISRKSISNKYINNLATFVFPIYLIHLIYKDDLTIWIMNALPIPYLIQIAIAIIILFISPILIDQIRRLTLGKVFDWLSRVELSFLKKLKTKYLCPDETRQ